MAVSKSHNERSNKRRKLSPPEEDHEHETWVSKRKAKTTDARNGDVPTTTPHSLAVNNHATEELPSVKDLASSESSLRRAAMKAITKHLESRSPSNPLSPTECLQLWRGFWVAIYMHDSKNAISVQNLLRDIAHTFAIVSAKDEEAQKAENGGDQAPDPNKQQHVWLTTYHTAFHETMVHEWAGIDSHRLNKALLTYRFVTRELFQLCFGPLFVSPQQEPTEPPAQKKTKKQSSKASNATQTSTSTADEASCAKAISISTSIIHVLETAGPLNPSDRKIPDGLRLHILDIWNDELFGALDIFTEQSKSDDESESSAAKSRSDGMTAVLGLLRQPLERTAKSDSGAQRHVRMRAKDTLQGLEEREKGISAD